MAPPANKDRKFLHPPPSPQPPTEVHVIER